MGFMRAYKRLDNLCRDMNGIGVAGYIEDMNKKLNGSYAVSGWKEDYQTLKHYRHIRNQIAHETYADEENMCSAKDEEWLENFYQRILKQSDPLALYHKIAIQRTANQSTQANHTQKTTHTSENYHPSNASRKPVGCATMIFSIAAIVVFIAILLSI